MSHVPRSPCKQASLPATVLFLIALFLPAALNATGWHTSGSEIYTPSGAVISNVNFYGFETTSYMADAEDYTFILNGNLVVRLQHHSPALPPTLVPLAVREAKGRPRATLWR
jgi:hypothetical protein